MPGCRKTSMRKYNFLEHLRSLRHAVVMHAFACPVPGCDKWFDSADGFDVGEHYVDCHQDLYTSSSARPVILRSHWDRLPVHVCDQIMRSSSNLTLISCGLLDLASGNSLPVAEQHAIWHEAFNIDWGGDLRLLPTAHLASLPRRIYWEIRSTHMYHRVVRLRGHDAESVMQAAIRNKWFAFLDTRFGVRLSYLAAECGGTRLFKRICERFRGLPVTPQHAITAAFNGSLDIVKFIFRVARKNPSAMASIAVPQVMDAAACNGHLAIVEFLHNEIRLKCTAAAMQKAATSGHLAVLQFLYNNKAEESPSHAMDAAARNGHLKIVAYLLEKNAKICMPRAVDGAVEGGHACVVELLHAHTPEAFTKSAMDAAARVGSLAMLTWLHDNVGIGCTTAALIDAAAGGHDDVVRWLLRHMRDTDWDLVAAIRAAEKRGDAGMSRLLREYGQANFLDVA